MVISTALGQAGRGIFPYTLLPGYRRLLQAVRDTGATVVQLTTHALPPDGSYATFLTNIANLVAENLK